MTTHVHTARVLDPDQAVVLSDALGRAPADWLPQGTRRAGQEWTLSLRVGRVVRVVRCQVGPALRRGGHHVSRRLAWVPVDPSTAARDRLLPAFEGEIRLDGEPGAPAVVVMAGRYDPPGGRAGRGIDALLMRHVAAHTVSALLDDVLEGLGRPDDTEERAHVHR